MLKIKWFSSYFVVFVSKLYSAPQLPAAKALNIPVIYMFF